MDQISSPKIQSTQAVSEQVALSNEPEEPKSPCSSSEENEDPLAFVYYVQSGELAKENNIKVKVRL